MQIEHKTEKGTVLFLKLSENESPLFVDGKGLHYVDNTMFSNMPLYKELPKGEWQLFGLISEITEDQSKMMFNAISTAQIDGVWYSWDNNRYTEDTAVKSFKSLMQHLHVYEVNPINPPSTENNPKKEIQWQRDLQKYREAESRTGKWIVLFKPNENEQH